MIVHAVSDYSSTKDIKPVNTNVTSLRVSVAKVTWTVASHNCDVLGYDVFYDLRNVGSFRIAKSIRVDGGASSDTTLDVLPGFQYIVEVRPVTDTGILSNSDKVLYTAMKTGTKY